MERRDIHDYAGRAERAFNAILKSEISEKNKNIIGKFRNFCIAQGLTTGRIAKHLWGLLVIGRILKKAFDITTREDIESLVAELRSKDYSNSSLVDFNITIKKFYNWLKQYPPKQYPAEVRWLSTAKKDEHLRDPSEDLTLDEIRMLAEAAEHVRDKALLWVLYETGARVGELLQIRIKDVSFDKLGYCQNLGREGEEVEGSPSDSGKGRFSDLAGRASAS
jgi:integrase